MCNPSLMLCEPPPTLPEVAMDASPFDAPALSPGNAAAQGAAATMPAPLDTSLAADGSDALANFSLDSLGADSADASMLASDLLRGDEMRGSHDGGQGGGSARSNSLTAPMVRRCSSACVHPCAACVRPCAAPARTPVPASCVVLSRATRGRHFFLRCPLLPPPSPLPSSRCSMAACAAAPTPTS